MQLEAVLTAFRDGRLPLEDAIAALKRPACEDLGFAKLDFQRELRKGFGETVFCPGKTDAQLLAIFEAFRADGRAALGTRCSPGQHAFLQAGGLEASYDPVSRLVVLRPGSPPSAPSGLVAVCTGGTGDLPVAEEAAQTAEFFGAKVERHYDVGVAGLHRLLAKIDGIRQANAIVAIAGMEGALGSVIAGLVDVPVVAVPTSVGYGASFAGVAPLLSMLSSCAEGLAVVNIDNGFGAGYLAAQINRLVGRRT
ncbi:MAG: nickel pincer cofactor biosynthesis protein LarB [Kiritimatiellia bacterium]|jgi:NCAIR mutase (PurE)-related protein